MVQLPPLAAARMEWLLFEIRHREMLPTPGGLRRGRRDSMAVLADAMVVIGGGWMVDWGSHKNF